MLQEALGSLKLIEKELCVQTYSNLKKVLGFREKVYKDNKNTCYKKKFVHIFGENGPIFFFIFLFVVS